MKITSLQPLADNLRQEVNDFVASVTYSNAYPKATFNRLMAQCEALQKTDVVKACLLRAVLYSAIGDFKENERMLRNAEINGGVAEARIERFTHQANHGMASMGLALADDVFANRDGKTLMDMARGAVAVGGFNKVVTAVQASLKNNEVLKMTTLYDLACRGASVMGQLGVSDVQLAAMLDVAGEKMRADHLLWMDERPDITVLAADQGGPAMAFEYRVDVTPAVAAQMTWDLAEALVTRDLNRPHIAVGFLGTRLQACVAA